MGALIYVHRRGAYLSEGSRLLCLRMRRANLSQADLRASLQLSAGQVGRWLRGERRPQAHWRRALLARFGIPVDAWMQKPTKRFSLEEDAA